MFEGTPSSSLAGGVDVRTMPSWSSAIPGAAIPLRLVAGGTPAPHFARVPRNGSPHRQEGPARSTSSIDRGAIVARASRPRKNQGPRNQPTPWLGLASPTRLLPTTTWVITGQQVEKPTIACSSPPCPGDDPGESRISRFPHSEPSPSNQDAP